MDEPKARTNEWDAGALLFLRDGSLVAQGPGQEGPVDAGAADARAMVEAQWPAVYRLCYRLCGNAHDAEELAQETFLKALEKWHQFQTGTNLRAWLFRIATNSFITSKRRAKVQALGDAMNDLPANSAPMEAGLVQGEVAKHVEAAILRLSETQRAVFVLRTNDELPFAEISAIIGITETTVRWHMSQARQQLIKLLEGKL